MNKKIFFIAFLAVSTVAFAGDFANENINVYGYNDADSQIGTNPLSDALNSVCSVVGQKVESIEYTPNDVVSAYDAATVIDGFSNIDAQVGPNSISNTVNAVAHTVVQKVGSIEYTPNEVISTYDASTVVDGYSKVDMPVGANSMSKTVNEACNAVVQKVGSMEYTPNEVISAYDASTVFDGYSKVDMPVGANSMSKTFNAACNTVVQKAESIEYAPNEVISAYDTSTVVDGYSNVDMPVGANSVSNPIQKASKAFKDWAFPVAPAKEEKKSIFSKAWDANIFGYEGAGKYALTSTAAAIAIVTAYIAYRIGQPTLEDQVVALVDKAQENPNLVLKELPGILAQCSNEDARVEVLQFVLSQVKITPEIAAAFNLHQ